MADWVALAGIASTALVAVAAQVGTALTKRVDRKQAFQLDFDKRVWEAKSAALVSVIAKCQRLKDATDVDPPGGPSPRDTNREARRKLLVIQEFDAIGLDLYGGTGADLLAYADESVRKPFAELSKLISHEYVQQMERLVEIESIKRAKESAVDEADFDVSASLRQQEVKAEIALGNASTLEVDALAKLCDQILEAARKDLRGK